MNQISGCWGMRLAVGAQLGWQKIIRSRLWAGSCLQCGLQRCATSSQLLAGRFGCQAGSHDLSKSGCACHATNPAGKRALLPRLQAQRGAPDKKLHGAKRGGGAAARPLRHTLPLQGAARQLPLHPALAAGRLPAATVAVAARCCRCACLSLLVLQLLPSFTRTFMLPLLCHHNSHVALLAVRRRRLRRGRRRRRGRAPRRPRQACPLHRLVGLHELAMHAQLLLSGQQPPGAY